MSSVATRTPCSGPPGWSVIMQTPLRARSRSIPSTSGRMLPAAAAAEPRLAVVSKSRARGDEARDGLRDPRLRRLEQVRVRGDDRFEVDRQALLGRDVGDEPLHEL